MFERKKIIDVLIVVMTVAMVVVSGLALLRIGYYSGFATAKSLVENSSFGDIIRIPSDIRTLSGTVTAVNGDRLTLHVTSNNPFYPFVDRTVLVASSTKVVKFTKGDTAVFKKEMDAYTKSTKSALKGIPTTIQPETFTIATITITDIMVGDFVVVTSSVNIKSLQTFIADMIQVQVFNARSTAP